MASLDQRERRDDPYAPVPTWRVDGLERQIERVEREAREARQEKRTRQVKDVERIERRLNDLSETWTKTYLLHLTIIGVMVLIAVAAAGHH